VAGLFAAARLPVPPPQAAFYVYPDFEPWREHLWSERGVRTGTGLARHLLEHYGAGVLPASRGSPRRSAGSAASSPTWGRRPAANGRQQRGSVRHANFMMPG
jgi:hypothetical protein